MLLLYACGKNESRDAGETAISIQRVKKVPVIWRQVADMLSLDQVRRTMNGRQQLPIPSAQLPYMADAIGQASPNDVVRVLR